MSFFRFLTGLLGGAAVGLLFANKNGKKLRSELKGKSSKEIAEILGKEFLKVGKDVKGELEEVAESEAVQKMVKKGKAEAKKVVKKATAAAKKTTKKATASAKKTAKKTTKKATTAAKKTVKKATKAVKKATS